MFAAWTGMLRDSGASRDVRVVLPSSCAKFVCRVPNQTNRSAFTKGFSPCQWVLGMDAKSRLGNPTDKLPPVTVDAMLNDTTFQRHTTQRTAATTALVLANSPFRFNRALSRRRRCLKSPTTESSRWPRFQSDIRRFRRRRWVVSRRTRTPSKTVTRVKYVHFLLSSRCMSYCHVAPCAHCVCLPSANVHFQVQTFQCLFSPALHW